MSKTLHFAIVFRHPATCNNYEHVCHLLQRTITSLLNQQDNDFKVIIVGNKRPSFRTDDARVEFIEADLPIPKSRNDVLLDKAVKRLFALQEVIKNQGKYFVTLDADDLVSIRFVSTVKALLAEHPNGLVLNRGYLLDFHNQQVQEKFGFNYFCGSSLVLSVADTLLGLEISQPDLMSISSYDAFLAQTNSTMLRDLLGNHKAPSVFQKSLGRPLYGVNIPLCCWVINNGENISKTTIGAGTKTLSKAFLAEFALSELLPEKRANFNEMLIERWLFLKSLVGHMSRNL